MAEAHDQHGTAGCQVAHGKQHRLGMLALHLGRHLGRKDLVAAVHPCQRKRQRGQRPHQGLPHMAATEQRQWHMPLREPGAQCRGIGGRHGLQGQMHHPTAALPQTGAQRMPLLGLQRRSRQGGTGMGGRLPLQVAATDGAHLSVPEHGHPGTRLARA